MKALNILSARGVGSNCNAFKYSHIPSATCHRFWGWCWWSKEVYTVELLMSCVWGENRSKVSSNTLVEDQVICGGLYSKLFHSYNCSFFQLLNILLLIILFSMHCTFSPLIGKLTLIRWGNILLYILNIALVLLLIEFITHDSNTFHKLLFSFLCLSNFFRFSNIISRKTDLLLNFNLELKAWNIFLPYLLYTAFIS